MSLKNLCCALALVMGWTGLMAGNTQAGVLTFTSEVVVASGASLGTTVFTSDTPVTFVGEFDPTTSNLYNEFSSETPFTSMKVEISGVGVFVVENANSLYLNFIDFSSIQGIGAYFVGINGVGVDSDGEDDDAGFYASYQTSSSVLSPNNLAPSVFSDWTETSHQEEVIWTLALAGGENFVIYEILNLPATASITGDGAVPEPTSLAIFGLGSLLVAARRTRRLAK